MIPDPPEVPDDPPETAPDPVVDLPPVDSIDAATDLAPWLRAGVPAAILNAALRRKWLATPAIRDYVDPALDYAWDWNAAAAVPGASGRIAADAAERMLRALTEPPPPPAAPERTEPVAAEDEPVADAPSAPPPAPTDPAATQAAPSDPESRSRRHGGALPRAPG